jgi:hypothetical protein
MCVHTAYSLTPTFRSPEVAKIKQKMLFASSKEALRRALVGIEAEIQGTEYFEVAYESGILLVLIYSYILSHQVVSELTIWTVSFGQSKQRCLRMSSR